MNESFKIREVASSELLEAPLREAVIGLLATSWEQPSKTLMSCVEDVDFALLLENECGLIGFISWRTQSFDDCKSHRWALAYIGLGSVAETEKQSGAGKLLVLEAIKRSHSQLTTRYPSIPDERKWVWGTTASPVAYFGLRKHSQEFIPANVTDKLDELLKPIVPFIYQCLGTSAQSDPKNELIARCASSLRYTDQEVKRLAGVAGGAFSKFEIDESKGDRLVMLMRPKL